MGYFFTLFKSCPNILLHKKLQLPMFYSQRPQKIHNIGRFYLIFRAKIFIVTQVEENAKTWIIFILN